MLRSSHLCLNCGREIDPDRIRIDQASQTVHLDGYPLPMDERVCSPHCLGRLRRHREESLG